MPTTARGAFPYPSLSDPADVPADLQRLADRLDAIAALADQGTLANRPAAGTRGRFYMDTANNQLYYDTGSTWVQVNSLGGAATTDGPANQGTLRTLGTGALQAASGADARLSDTRVPTDNSVTAAKINTALKPSAGAGASTEALRAIGFGSGQVAAGTHASQHGSGGSDPLTVTPAMLQAGPYARAARYTNFTVGVGGGGMDLALALAVEEADNANMWSSGAPSYFTVPYSGLYYLTIMAFISDPNPGNNRGQFYISGATNLDNPELSVPIPPIPNDGYEMAVNGGGILKFTAAGNLALGVLARSGTYQINRMQVSLAFVGK